MPLIINIPGATNAGRRRVKQHPDWRCDNCKQPQPGDRYSCPACRQRRPR